MAALDYRINYLVVAFGVLILLAPIAAPREAYVLKYLVWSGLIGLSYLAIWKGLAKSWIRSPITLAVIWLIFAGLLQVMPLIHDWLDRFLSFGESVRLPVAGVELNTISFAPSATIDFVHGCVVLLAVCWWRASYVGAAKAGRQIIEYAIIASATAQAVYGTLSVVTGAELGAFLNIKDAYLGSATGTFVNRSVYGLYLNLAIVACLRVLFFSEAKRSGYVLVAIRIAMVLLVVGVTMSHSRAVGLGFLLVMMGGAVAALIRQRKKSVKSFAFTLLMLVSVVIIDLLVVSNWFGLERLKERAAATSVEVEQRDDIAKLLLQEYQVSTAPLGLGLGSFEVIYPRLETQYQKGRYVRAHADLVELWVSLGLLAVPLVILAVWALLSSGVVGGGLGAALLPHLLLDFAASHWLIWVIVILLWPIRPEAPVRAKVAPTNI